MKRKEPMPPDKKYCDCNEMKMALQNDLIYPVGHILPNRMYSDHPFLKRICPLTGTLYWRKIHHCPFCGMDVKTLEHGEPDSIQPKNTVMSLCPCD